MSSKDVAGVQAADAAPPSDERLGGVQLGGRESELKLEIDPADLAALERSDLLAGEDASTRDQDAVYFDTEGEALQAAGFSLRIRTIEGTRVQTVKAEGAAAAGLFVRPEWEREVAGDAPELDDDDLPLQALVPAGDLDRLQPVFRIRVRRTVNLLERDGASVELVLDRGEVTAGDRSGPICEVELELKRGGPAALFGLARELDAIAPVRLGVLAKSQRGYRLRGSSPNKPAKAEPLALQPGTTTAAGFQLIVGACVRHFRLNEALLTRTGDPGALHQARVALRRLRSALSTFRRVVEDDSYGRLRGELRWLAAELGQARNLDVLLGRIASDQAAEPIKAAREVAYGAVADALASTRVRALMIDLSEWTAIGAWTADPSGTALRDQPLEEFAATVLERHRRRLKRRGRHLDRQSDGERHEARIEAKKLRYATEFFATLFPKGKAVRRHRAFLDALEALQEHLGELNDIATAPVVLAELKLAGAPTAHALQTDTSARGPLLDRAVEAHSTLMDVKRFWR